MAETVRIPITNVLTGGQFAMSISVGAQQQRVNVILDTGSSMLVVDGAIYDPSGDTGAVTSQILAKAEFGSGDFHAAIVRTPVGLVTGPGAPVATLAGADLAVTYDSPPGTFDQADGIFGLAYAALNNGYRMPADTWQNKYTADQLAQGQRADIVPFAEQLAAAHLVTDKFAFAVRRSLVREVLDDPATDPLNQGIFVLGGGAECTDLYIGPLASIAVVHERYYNTNLMAIQVGDRSVAVPPIAPGGSVASNSIVDSGSPYLMLDRTVYSRVIDAFRAFDPTLEQLLQTYFLGNSQSIDQTQLDLTKWPTLRLILQGNQGEQVAIDIASKNYWQFDVGQAGNAAPMLVSDNGALNGQSNLGLPLFADRFVAFDRSGPAGRGTIGFADRAENAVIA
jgi:hypothetical protein